MTNSVLKNLFYRKNYILYFLLFFIFLVLGSRLHIDWLWYRQFTQQDTYLKTLILQFKVLIVTGLISIICLLWQSKWAKEISTKNSNVPRISGLVYGISLLVCLVSITLIVWFLFSVSYISILDPFNQNLLSIDDPARTSRNILQLISIIVFTSITLTLPRGSTIVQTIGSLLFIFISVRRWGLWSLAFSIPDTGVKESLYDSDISFGLARYPALSFGLVLILAILSLTASTSIWNKLIKNPNFTDWSSPTLTRKEKIILSPIFALITFVGSSLLWLSRHHFLWNVSGQFPGAGWLDVNFNIPLRTYSSIALFLSALLLIPFTNDSKRRLVRKLLVISSLLALISEFIFAPLLQWLFVKPRELILEKVYLERAINATRKAFMLDSIKTRLINPENMLTSEDIEKGRSSLRNVRLWDSQPLLATNRQLQQFKVFYRFSNTAVDRYQLKADSNERQQVIITARELDQDGLPISSRTWLNKHFVFTHGYGFTISPVNTKGADGLPEYFIKDLGASTKINGSKLLGITKSSVQKLIPIGNDAIYYGTLNTPYAIAPSVIEEFDYPKGDQNIFKHYDGNGGVPISNLLERISASFYFLEPRLLNTGALTKHSKILFKRDIKQRILKLAPFINLLGEPYLVTTKVNQGKEGYYPNQHLYWIVEGYTLSKTYPYAERLSKDNSVRYIRNSVKIIVDTYNGNLNLYVSEPQDPIIIGWQTIFPKLFKKLEDMPSSLREHLKVPTDLFEYQVKQLLRYHVTDIRTFYNGDDLWQVPKELYGKKQIPVKPYHVTAQLGPNSETEFLLLQPLTPLARPNLSAWLAARSDGKNYGELVLLRFPGQTTIFGPEQIQALINQDPFISQQFSLWDRAGSEVIQGNLLVLPLGKSLIYVEPVYLKATQGGVPTLTRVVVSDGKRISMEATLSEALSSLLAESKTKK